MNQIYFGSILVGVVEVRALNTAQPVEPVRVMRPDERTVLNLAEPRDAAGQTVVRWSFFRAAEPAETACSRPLDRRRQVDIVAA